MQGKKPMELHPVMQCMLEAAIRAPSGDNCQPWQFQVLGESAIRVSIVTERAESFFDYGGRGTLISLGAVVENMRIQAAGEGITVEVDYDMGDQGNVPQAVVRLNFDQHATPIPGRVKAMLCRTVNRRPFLPIHPARKKLEAILANPVDDVKVTVIDRRRDIWRWARLIYLADIIRYTHPVIHEELFDKILFTRQIAHEKRIGLEINRLGAGPAAAMIMHFLQPWERMQRLQKYGIDRALAGQSRFLALSSGALLLVSVPQDTRTDWLRAGEQVERLWVKAEEQGLSVHPMTVALFLHQRYRNEGLTQFLPGHFALLEEIDTELGSLLRDQTGTMLFRLGVGWRMKDTAIRMPLESFLQ